MSPATFANTVAVMASCCVFQGFLLHVVWSSREIAFLSKALASFVMLLICMFCAAMTYQAGMEVLR